VDKTLRCDGISLILTITTNVHRDIPSISKNQKRKHKTKNIKTSSCT
jgi:hypothetical protein